MRVFIKIFTPFISSSSTKSSFHMNSYMFLSFSFYYYYYFYVCFIFFPNKLNFVDLITSLQIMESCRSTIGEWLLPLYLLRDGHASTPSLSPKEWSCSSIPIHTIYFAWYIMYQSMLNWFLLFLGYSNLAIFFVRGVRILWILFMGLLNHTTPSCPTWASMTIY